MNKELSSPIALTVGSTRILPWLRVAGVILAGSVLLAVCSRVAVPLWFTPVPLTIQPFAVLLLGLLLSPRLAFATLAAYLAEGAIGLPVFAPTPAIGGFAHLFGPTAGYLVAYPVAAALIAFLRHRGPSRFFTAFASAALGDLVILSFGALWLAAFTHAPALNVLGLAVLPFLPGDVLKVAAAAGVAVGLRRFRQRRAQSRANA
ncbi:MAG TPA: biotin transporter BioY [Terracidiphilus sp.]|nr:biotin transporter BioY [Terracidiphilus sp.]